jgi:tRNA modification GTPase
MEVLQDGNYSERTAIVSSVRHYDCLTKAKESLKRALKTVSENLSGEFLASDLRAAETSLAEIIGEVNPEDILDNIFSKFCIGK